MVMKVGIYKVIVVIKVGIHCEVVMIIIVIKVIMVIYQAWLSCHAGYQLKVDWYPQGYHGRLSSLI